MSAKARLMTLSTALIALPLMPGVVVHETPGVSFGVFRLATFHYFDLFLILAVGAALMDPKSLRRPRTVVSVTAAAIVVATIVSLAFTPSPRGVSMVLRWIAGGVLFMRVAAMDRSTLRTHVALPLLGTATVQGLLSWAQLLTDSSLGLDFLGSRAPRIVNEVARSAGTFGVPYVLAAFSLVAVGIGVAVAPRPLRASWAILLGGATIPIAITFSRSAMVGFVIAGLIALVAVRRDRGWIPIVLTVAVAFAIPATIHLSSWTTRIEQSNAAELSPDENVRFELVDQATTLLAAEPFTGVGTGRYSLALEERFALTETTAHPVHNAPLLLMVEVGVLLGAVVFGGLVLTARSAWRASTGARVLLVIPLGFVLFDHLNVTHPVGPILTMIWLAVLAALVESEESPGAETELDRMGATAS